jgi:hypothetical protein
MQTAVAKQSVKRATALAEWLMKDALEVWKSGRAFRLASRESIGHQFITDHSSHPTTISPAQSFIQSFITRTALLSSDLSICQDPLSASQNSPTSSLLLCTSHIFAFFLSSSIKLFVKSLIMSGKMKLNSQNMN